MDLVLHLNHRLIGRVGLPPVFLIVSHCSSNYDFLLIELLFTTGEVSPLIMRT